MKMGMDIRDRVKKRINELAAGQLAALEVAVALNNNNVSANKYKRAVAAAVSRAPATSVQSSSCATTAEICKTSGSRIHDLDAGQLAALGVAVAFNNDDVSANKHNCEPLPPRKRHSPERVCEPRPAESVPVATCVPWAMSTTRTGPIPKSVELLWQRISAIDPFPNTPTCCDTCPFTTGALMLRRYNIMIAMMNLEDHLYYNGTMMP